MGSTVSLSPTSTQHQEWCDLDILLKAASSRPADLDLGRYQRLTGWLGRNYHDLEHNSCHRPQKLSPPCGTKCLVNVLPIFQWSQSVMWWFSWISSLVICDDFNLIFMNLCIAEVLLDHGTQEGKERSQGGGPGQPGTSGQGWRARLRCCSHLCLLQRHLRSHHRPLRQRDHLQVSIDT